MTAARTSTRHFARHFFPSRALARLGTEKWVLRPNNLELALERPLKRQELVRHPEPSEEVPLVAPLDPPLERPELVAGLYEVAPPLLGAEQEPQRPRIAAPPLPRCEPVVGRL